MSDFELPTGFATGAAGLNRKTLGQEAEGHSGWSLGGRALRVALFASVFFVPGRQALAQLTIGGGTASQVLCLQAGGVVTTNTNANCNAGGSNTNTNGNISGTGTASFATVSGTTVQGTTASFGTVSAGTVSATTFSARPVSASTVSATTVRRSTASVNAPSGWRNDFATLSAACIQAAYGATKHDAAFWRLHTPSS